MSDERWDLPSGTVLNVEWCNSVHTGLIETEIKTVERYLQRLKHRRNAVASPLLQLPLEIIVTIFDLVVSVHQLKDVATLKRCSLACTDLCAILRPLIFSRIHLLSETDCARAVRFALAEQRLYGLATTILVGTPLDRWAKDHGEEILAPLRRVNRVIITMDTAAALASLAEVSHMVTLLAQISRVDIDRGCQFSSFLDIATLFPNMSSFNIWKLLHTSENIARITPASLHLTSLRVEHCEIPSDVFMQACSTLRPNVLRTLYFQLPEESLSDDPSSADDMLRSAGASLRVLHFAVDSSDEPEAWAACRLTAAAMCESVTHLHLHIPVVWQNTLWISGSMDVLHELRLHAWEAVVFELQASDKCIMPPTLSALCSILLDRAPRMVRYVFNPSWNARAPYEDTYAALVKLVGEPMQSQAHWKQEWLHEFHDFDLAPLVTVTSHKTVLARFHISSAVNESNPKRRICEITFIVRDNIL